MENTGEVKQSEGQDNNKINQKFEQNTKKLVALFQGNERVLSKKRSKSNELTDVIDELLKEKKEEKKKLFKEKASKLLQSKVEFDRFIVEEQKKFEQAILNKKKEFNKEMEDCFSLVEDIDIMANDYHKSLSSVLDEKKPIE